MKEESIVDNNGIDKASFFEGNFSWVGINVVMKISVFDLENINRWLKKHPSLFPRENDEFNNSFDSGGGYRNLGYFYFNRENNIPYTEIIMDRASLYSSRCKGTIHYQHYGNTYLNLYFILNENSTKMIKDLCVKEVKGKKEIVSLAPWSRYFFSIVNTTKRKITERLLRERFNTVVEDINNATLEILKLLNIKEKETKIVFSEYIRESDEKYFSDSKVDYDEKYQHQILRYGPERERYKVKGSKSEFFNCFYIFVKPYKKGISNLGL